MQEIVKVLETAKCSIEARSEAQRNFLSSREQIWFCIRDGKFPTTYVSTGKSKFSGATARTAIRCDFLMACKIALGQKYRKDEIADAAQRDLLFHVLRYREAFPCRVGKKFYCCPKCTGKLHECLTNNVFRYIDNAKWSAEIES